MTNPDSLSAIQSSVESNLTSLITSGSDYVKAAGSLVVKVAGGFFSALFEVVLILTLAVFFSIDKAIIVRFLSNLRGPSKREYISLKLEKTYNKLGIWLRSQLFLSLYIGVITWIGLTVIGFFGINLTNTGTLAVISGLTEVMPYLGPSIGAIPAMFVAGITHGIWGIVTIMCLYFAIQWTESNIVVPLVMNKALGVNPLVIFLCVLAGGVIFGFIGIVLAVPLAVILTVIVDDDFE